ncbi:hypothetical protein F7725_022261 [Xyrichtys novacula]|uniref:Uncharacterized protein n=1 Tax=Xyrichtys novacula TaxID=13765 RepID=A0AAV1FCB0_XYRNO|nr:hypothetical protein F7725_022261 [Xyrichtys novacula]
MEGKIDNLAMEEENLANRDEEVETWLKGWAAEVTHALCTCLDQQKDQMQKHTELRVLVQEKQHKSLWSSSGTAGELEYNEIRKVLKEKVIPFQTPYMSMLIHWSKGFKHMPAHRRYSGGLRPVHSPVEEPVCQGGTQQPGVWLNKLLGWQQVADPHMRRLAAVRRAKEKLQEFQKERAERIRVRTQSSSINMAFNTQTLK